MKRAAKVALFCGSAELPTLDEDLLGQLEEVYCFSDIQAPRTPQTSRSKKIRTLPTPHALGYGGRQKIAYRYAIDKQFDWVVFLPTTDEAANHFVRTLLTASQSEDGAVVLGSAGSQRTRVTARTLNWGLGISLSEYRATHRAYSVRALERIPFEQNSDGEDFDTQILVQLRALGAQFLETSLGANGTLPRAGIRTKARFAWRALKSVLEYRLHQLHVIRRGRFLVNREFLYTTKRSPYGSHEQIVALMQGPGRALDLGSSHGLLTTRLEQKGIRSVGVDRVPSEQVTAPFETYVQADLEQSEALRFSREFDYVVLADVIEHLVGARALLRRSRSFLKPEGRLVISTPNIAIWFYRLSLLMGRFNYGPKGILDQTHVHLYTVDSFRSLLENSGYLITRETYTSLPFEVVFESVGKSRSLQFVDKLYYALVRFWPRLFAYQIILEAKIAAYETGEVDNRA